MASSTSTIIELRPYREPFKAAVLKHIREMLGADEWARLRSMAAYWSRFQNRNATADLKATPEKLFDTAFSEVSISVQETLVPGFKLVDIGRIEGQPVYYVERRGIYLWGLRPDSRPTLSFWITYPAYPPGW